MIEPKHQKPPIYRTLEIADDPVPTTQFSLLNPIFKDNTKQYSMSSLKQSTFEELNDENTSPVEQKMSYLNLFVDKPKQFKDTIVIRSRIMLSYLSVQDQHDHHSSVGKSLQNLSSESICKKSSVQFSVFSDQLMSLQVRCLDQKRTSHFGSSKLIEMNMNRNTQKLIETLSKQDALERKLSSMQKIRVSEGNKNFGLEFDMNQQTFSRKNIFIEKQCSIDHSNSKSILKKESSLSIDYRSISKDKVIKSSSKKKVRFGLTKVQLDNLQKVTKC